MRIEVAAGSASTGGKRGESTIEQRILSNDGVLNFSLQTRPTLHTTKQATVLLPLPLKEDRGEGNDLRAVEPSPFPLPKGEG